ncbi:hypothetical protein CDIK_1642 [Cucumispora dikerogammari]|nr:hypothetical protein CDIK_1642 [Cucumispora dikerogammari]
MYTLFSRILKFFDPLSYFKTKESDTNITEDKIIEVLGITRFYKSLRNQMISNARYITYKRSVLNKPHIERLECIEFIKNIMNQYKKIRLFPEGDSTNRSDNNVTVSYQGSQDEESEKIIKEKTVLLPFQDNKNKKKVKVVDKCSKKRIVCHVLMLFFSVYYIFRLGAGFGKQEPRRLVVCFTGFLAYFLYLM